MFFGFFYVVRKQGSYVMKNLLLFLGGGIFGLPLFIATQISKK
jgi:hypothetical protein